MKKILMALLSAIIGSFAAIVALFYLIQTITQLFNFDFEYGTAKTNIYVTMLVLCFAITCVGFCLSAIFQIKKYIKSKEYNNELVINSIITYFTYEIVIGLVVMAFWGFDSIKGWIIVALSFAGLIISFVPYISKINDKNKNTIELVASILSFVLAIIGITYSDGLMAATYVFLMLLFALTTIYFISLVIGDSKNSNNEVRKNKKDAIDADVKEIN